MRKKNMLSIRYMIYDAFRMCSRWPYYALLVCVSVAVGSLMIILSLGMVLQQTDLMDAKFLEPERLIRYYWRDKDIGDIFENFASTDVEEISLFYTRDQMVYTRDRSYTLRVAHVDDTYLKLAGKKLAERQVALDHNYLSQFGIAEGDTLFLDGTPHQVVVIPGLMDVEQQALVFQPEPGMGGIKSWQSIIKISQSAERELVRNEIESIVGTTAVPMVEENRAHMRLSYIYPDEQYAIESGKNRSVLIAYGFISFIVMLYVMFQAISIARYYLNRMRREWTMLRLYCGRNICFAKFFCETLVYALFGTTIAWFVLPLYFQYVGSGFYLPTNSLGIMVAMLPMLIIATLLLTEISFFDFRKNSIAEQFSEK